MAESKLSESKDDELDAKGGRGAKDDEPLMDRVRKFCMSQGFEREFEDFAAKHCELFIPAIDRPKDGEHDLEFHNIYREYLSTFEGRIESFVKCAGGTAEEFSRDARECLENSPPDDLNRFFVEALLATTEYEIFLMLMVDEARKHRDHEAEREGPSHK